MKKQFNIHGRKPQEEWTPIVADDTQFRVFVFGRKEKPDRKDLFLLRSRDRSKIAHHKAGNLDVAKIVYREPYKNAIQFMGIYVPQDLRDQGIGRQFFRYFRDEASERGYSFTGTSRIHKPLLALMLQKEEMIPASRRCEAEILPPLSDSPLEVPLLRFIRRDLPENDMVSRSTYGPFYYEATPEQARMQPIDYDKVVALHTSFRAPGPSLEAVA